MWDIISLLSELSDLISTEHKAQRRFIDLQTAILVFLQGFVWAHMNKYIHLPSQRVSFSTG